MTAGMKIKALAPWFGGKRSMAPAIVRELGEHRSYWEPFCGSMAVLLAKPPASMETVNDLHRDLTNLARVIQHRTLGPKLYRHLRRVLMGRDLFTEARETLAKNCPDTPCVDRAAAYFVASWQGRNGMSGTASSNTGYSARYTHNGGHAARRWASAVDSIPAWRRRMREVQIERGDAFEMLARVGDQDGAVIYCDSPYVVKGAKYVHDFTDTDHARLAELLKRFNRARVVVSYYDHPLVRELYDGWTFVDHTRTKALVSQGKRDAGNDTKAPEVLIINGPSYAEQQGLLQGAA